MKKTALQKKRMASDLALGEEVADIFLLSTAQQAQARNGPYWRLEFRDASGTLGGKIWSPQSQAYSDLVAGCLVWVKAKVGSYRDTPELAVEDLRVLSAEESAGLELSLFVPASAHKPADMLDALLELSREVLAHKPWYTFVTSLLADQEIAAAFCHAPAAKSMHHAYSGGLLEHTLSVCRLCMRLADQYPALDRQVLFAGALCHDLGKLWELSTGLTAEYTTPGRLIGHISLGLERLAPFIKESGLEPEMVEHLQHLILSHHGSLEFGSPRLPATAEALILHYADNIDAKMQQVSQALSGIADGQSGWSAYNVPLERFLFKPLVTPESAPCSPAEPLAEQPLAEQPPAEQPPAEQPLAERASKGSPVQPLSLLSQCSLLSKG